MKRYRIHRWLPVLAAAVPLVATLAVTARDVEAQPRVRDRPSGGGLGGRLGVGGAGDASTPPTTTPTTTPVPATPTPGTTPTTPAKPTAAPTVGANGKAQSGTDNLSQFENALEFEPRSPNYKVAFSLEDADLAELVRVIAQLTGKRFIFGGKVKNIKATVYSPQKVTVAEAYQAFLSILEANKLTVVPHGRFLKIIDSDAAVSSAAPVHGSAQAAPNEERYVTRMHRLGNMAADDAATLLS